MAKVTKGRRRIASRRCRLTPYPLSSCDQDADQELHSKTSSKVSEKKDWEDATCSVCMECPHNAVLLLCSSHEKGCRPYMCGTSFRYSNCLDQYKKAYTKITSPHHGQPSHGSADNPIVGSNSGLPTGTCEITELACPLCRGQVKGWTVVEPAREYLNAKKRICMQDNCLFLGTYRELRKHVRAEHPSAQPHGVDPVLEQKWRRLEQEREREDVISTITSSMPRAIVFGDYVIEGSHYGFDTEEEEGFGVDAADRDGGFEVGINNDLFNVFVLLHTLGTAGNVVQNRGARRHERGADHTTPVSGFDSADQYSDSDGDNDGISLVGRLRHRGRVLLGRSGRRRRHREANGERR